MDHTNEQAVFTVPYEGKRLPVFVDEKQWRSFRYVNRNQFRISPTLVKNQKKFEKEYHKFLTDNIRKVVDKYFDKLLNKRISFDIPYSDGSKRREKISAKEYAKLLGIEKIKYEIGSYKNEWGINQLSGKNKEFILHFNLNLLIYDNGEKLGYVVAHEVAHIFVRDHNREFNEVVEKLYGNARKYERFWDGDFNKI
jgi:predicted metal-dependent hydrolase